MDFYFTKLSRNDAVFAIDSMDTIDAVDTIVVMDGMDTMDAIGCYWLLLFL